MCACLARRQGFEGLMSWRAAIPDHDNSRCDTQRSKRGRSQRMTSTYINTIWLRHHIVDVVRRGVRSERGTALVEYAFLLSFIVVVCMAAVTVLGSNNSASATRSANSII